MKTASHYCLVSLLPRATANERVHIGLLHFSDSDGRFFVSDRRLKALNAFYDQPTSTLIRNLLRDMSDRWTVQDDMERRICAAEVWTIDRLIYLNRYSNNLIHVGELVEIALPFETNTFAKLVERFFGEQPQSNRLLGSSLKAKVKRLLSPFRDRLNLDYEFGLETSDLPSLTANIRVSAAGRNEQPLIAQAIEFNRTIDNIGRHTAELQALYHSFVEVKQKPKIFVVGEEPDAKCAQHEIWKRVYDVSFLEFVPLHEYERIADSSRVHQVKLYESIEG